MPALTTVAVAHGRAADAHHRPRPGRVEEPDQAVHAGLGPGDLGDAGGGSRLLHQRGAAGRRPNDPVEIPQGQGPAVAGAALYVRYGCINCHGPNGLGGVANPLSADKSIPPLSGGGFRHDFPTDKAIADVIRSGSVIGKAPIVSMPHWGGIIPQADITAMIAYLKTLK